MGWRAMNFSYTDAPFRAAQSAARAAWRRGSGGERAGRGVPGFFYFAQVGEDIDPRNSVFDFVLVRRLSKSSIASTVERGLKTLRRTQTRLNSSGGRSSSSLRVPER